jgi:hypothetical protein
MPKSAATRPRRVAGSVALAAATVKCILAVFAIRVQVRPADDAAASVVTAASQPPE